jgi:hypothetical protein
MGRMTWPVGTTGISVARKQAHTAKLSAAQSVSLPADVAKLLGLPAAGVSKTKNFGEYDTNIGGDPTAVVATNVTMTVTEFPQPQQPTLAIHLFTFSYSVTTKKWRSGENPGEVRAAGFIFNFVTSSGGVILATPLIRGTIPGLGPFFWPALIVNCGDSNTSLVQLYSISNDQQWLSDLHDILPFDFQGTYYQC